MKNGYYIRLFYPLEKEQSNDIFNIWKENITEDITVRFKKIEKYCEEKECDLMMALYRIYDSFNISYVLSDSNLGIYDYLNEATNSDFSRILKRAELDNEFQKIMRIKVKPIKFDIKILDKEESKSIEDIYKKFEKEFHPQPTINDARAKLIFEERTNIKSYIIELIKQRRESPEIYINDKVKTKVLIYKDSFSDYPYNDLEKLMYIPYTPDLLNNAQVNNQETEKQDNTKVINKEDDFKVKYFSKKYNTDQLKKLHSLLIEQGYINKDTKKIDFLYIFGNKLKNDCFSKLEWIKTGRNKDINKKMFLYLCMKLFELNYNEMNQDYLKYFNEITKFKSKLTHANKPHDDYPEIDELLKIIEKID